MQTAKDIMTSKVITVFPETPLMEAVSILKKNRFNGLPVVDQTGKVLGIITEYDLIIKGSSIHLPTFMKLFKELDLYKKDSRLIAEDLKKIFDLKVQDVMNNEPLTIPEETPIVRVVATFTEHHKVNPIIVVDADNKLTGVVSRSDMLKFFGDAELDLKKDMSQEDVQKNINIFLNNFEKNFILVGKSRTRLWLVASILFMIVGFLIAWFLILRINV